MTVRTRRAAGPRFVLHIEGPPGADNIKQLRWLLKGLLRQHGFRCLDLGETEHGVDNAETFRKEDLPFWTYRARRRASKRRKTMTDLYHVCSTAKLFKGFKNVNITWFMARRQQPVAPYAELIADYAELERDEDRAMAEDRVDEMFTGDEARALLAWLDEHRAAAHALLPHAMPIRARTDDGGLWIGVGATTVGGLQDFLVPSEIDWSLPFKAWGYYDLRFCEHSEEEQRRKYDAEGFGDLPF